MRTIKFNYFTERPKVKCPVCGAEVSIPMSDANVCPNCRMAVVDWLGNFFGYVTEPYFKNIWISKALIKKGTLADIGPVNEKLLNELREKWRRHNESRT